MLLFDEEFMLLIDPGGALGHGAKSEKPYGWLPFTLPPQSYQVATYVKR
jgi:hypothetical protein